MEMRTPIADVDKSAIEDGDDYGSVWEDDDDSGSVWKDEDNPFPRVELKNNLTSRRSFLTEQLHKDNRAQTLQNAASRSSPAIRRSRTPNGPSTGKFLQEDGLMMRQQNRPKPPVMSPRSTRRNMMQQELTGSLRQNLLWERQQKNATSNAVAKRQQSANSVPDLATVASSKNVDKDALALEYNRFYDQSLNVYHSTGW
ncbi:DUF1752-domain-containing protein [Ophiobolus disseminans]|uniref:DUF1752-domain-containing protein n=1 Tax=Ophiobolus disseminans TaxID=1469910 RepID=A0A6A6ZDA7_9PLEO|nr:DUF1752-domain-containing protein [Ophiobolus disseminans]